MKTVDQIQSIYARSQNVVGQEECAIHDQIYNLIETPGGIVGSCPKCFQEKIAEEDQKIVEKANENRDGWQVSFINDNERVSSDLMSAKVSTYTPNHKSQEEAKRMVIDYIKSFDKKKSLTLSGKSGNGKTHLAYATAKAVRQQGGKAWFVKTRDFLDLIRSTYQHGAQLTEDRIFKVVESVDLLILDDLGSEYVKSSETGNETWASDLLYAIFDARLNKSIVCTTNYTMNELEKKYGYNGERIVSRLLSNAKGVRLQGEDYRRKNNF